MKPCYKLGFFVQTTANTYGRISSVIHETDGVSYRLDGEPKEYKEKEIAASFRENKPKTATRKKATTAPVARRSKAATTESAQATQ